MFEDYLEDAYALATNARKSTNERSAKRDYRASVFYAISAIEAFVNYVGDTLSKAEKVEPYEVAFLVDKKFGIQVDKFMMLDQLEYHRLEDKLRYLMAKYVPSFDLGSEPDWQRFIEFKRFRDSLVHPRQEDEVGAEEYHTILEKGLASTIKIMNRVCNGIFGRYLRKKILDLTL